MVVKTIHIAGVILTLLILVSCKTFENSTSESFDTIELRNEYQLNYNLGYGDERYQFIVDIMNLNPDRQFRYTMTSKSKRSAVITILESALDSGYVEVNTFNGSNDTLGSNELTVWFSKRMFSQLRDSDTAWFVGNRPMFGRPDSTQYYNAGLESYSYELNGVPQTIEVMKVMRVTGDPQEFLILNDPDNPLIIKMNIGWEIRLKEINHNYE
jgi:hypothetical protein